MENFNELLHNLYYDIQNSSVAYTSKNNLYKKAKLLDKNITKNILTNGGKVKRTLLSLSL